MKFEFKPNLKEGLSGLKIPPFLAHPVVNMGLGVVIMLITAIMLFSGASRDRDSGKAYAQGQRAMAQVRDAVKAFEQTLQDKQVSTLAEMALRDSDTREELGQYLGGRISELRSFQLYEPGAYLSDPEELGENAWIAMDMMLKAESSGIAPVQLLQHGEEKVVAGLVAIGEPEDILGYLMVLAGEEAILSSFNMTMPIGGYMALEQNNGRFRPGVIRFFGDQAMAANGVTRIIVPGSTLRVVVPQEQMQSGTGGFPLLLMFLLGAVLLTSGVIIRQRNLHPVVELKQDPARRKTEKSAGQALAADPEEEAEDAEFAADSPSEAEESEPALPEVSLPDLSIDFGKRTRRFSEQAPPVELSAEIFRAYDIRGIVGKTLDSGIARQVGQAIGSLAVEEGATPVMVGRDGRHSGPDLVEGMIQGIASTGCDVVDIGAVPTGVLYFAACESGSGSGVMVTGSHNPPDYNGIKAMIGGKTLAQDRITGLYERLQNANLRVGKGQISEREMLQAYQDRIAGDIQLARPLKVVADCGNGIGGICAAEVLRAIGAEVVPLFDEVDGDFPNHHPDPSEPENLEDLIEAVKLMNADLGVAFDGDADRLGVVTPRGEIIFADRTMMLFAREILGRNPGAKIIYDVKCTGKLDAIIRDAGGEPEMYKTGHSLIKNRMKEVGAPFAGEMSGHFFFTDRWYGFDCGIYSAARLLEILALDERPPVEVLNSLPNDVSTPELKVQMSEGENHAFVKKFQEQARFVDARISKVDGLRADYEYGWGLVRASNTTPILVVRFEAENEESLNMVKEAFRLQMKSLDPDLDLPF